MVYIGIEHFSSIKLNFIRRAGGFVQVFLYFSSTSQNFFMEKFSFFV